MTKRYSFLVLSATLIMAACGGGGDKTAQLQQLKQEKVKYNEDIDKKIAALEKELGVKDSAAQKMKDVTVEEVRDTLFEHYIDVQGSVDARENVNVSARVPGVITAIFVREGQQVTKGQTLAQIDDQVLRANMAELSTQLDLANTL
jgi:multidrug efflux pump subunit AcrA (membrane-fusion protein)